MGKSMNRVAVIGAGVMGAGIAALLAGTGVQVQLLDIVPPAGLTDEEKSAGLTENSPAFRNRFSMAGYNRIKNPKMRMLFEKSQIDNISVGNMSDDLWRLKNCDWVIEVALEKLEVKRDIMQKLYANCGPDTIITTNTSGVSIRAIAEGMPEDFKERFLGTHFFNPPRYMRLFEMIPMKETKAEIVDRITEFAEKELGKVVVKAKDTPNFIANRIGVYTHIDAMTLMEKYGFNIPTVDMLVGTLMGRAKSASFRTADIVGLDIFENVSNNVLSNVDDPREQELYALPWFVKDRIANGALGDKTKQGFFKRTVIDGKKAILTFDLEKKTYEVLSAQEFDSVKAAWKSDNRFAYMVYGEGPENQYLWENLKHSLLYAARAIPEVADGYVEIDQALKAGFGWEVGLFEVWDKIGVEKSVERMRNEGEVLPEWIETRLKEGKTKFYEESAEASAYLNLHSGKTEVVKENDGATLHHLGDDVLCLEFHSKGNSITESVIDMMEYASEELSTGKWTGLVIGNEGKTFCAGADLSKIAALSKEGRWDELEVLIGRLQQATYAFKHAEYPVVAAPFGSAVGGGAEVVMHTAAVTPYVETYVGLVEAGVGLIPAGGGSKELLMRNCERCSEKGKTALLPVVKKTWKQLAMATVSSSAFDAAAKGYMPKDTHVVFQKNALIQQAKKQVIELSDWGYHPKPMETISVLGGFGKGAILYEIQLMEDGRFITAYDAEIGRKIAHVLTGGNVPCGTQVTEQYILDLEKEVFLSLCGEERTQARIASMLMSGKPLRN